MTEIYAQAVDPASLKPKAITGDLDQSQHAAVTTASQHVLVVAGAGSGKTRVLTRRAAWLLSQGVPAGTLMTMTFTNKAADEMKERLTALGLSVKNMWVGTFHSLCVRMLRHLGSEVGVHRGFVIYDEEDRDTLLKEILKTHSTEDRDTLHRVRSTISRWKNGLVSPSAAAGTTDQDELFTAKIYKEYEERLTANNAVDFDGLLVKAVRLLERSHQAREWIHGRFRHLLVDEYQDTNLAQYRLLALMKSPKCAMFVVGDADQSVYGFRGADVRNILHFKQDFPDVQVVNLTYNYRSCPEIVQSADMLVKNNKHRLEEKCVVPFRRGVARIALHEASNEQTEADFVVGIIKCLKTFGYSLNEVAVLFRTRIQARLFEKAFLEERIPYRIVGGPALGDRAEAKDLLAFLKVILNPQDSVSLKRVFTVYPGLGKTAFKKVQDIMNVGDNVETLINKIKAQATNGSPTCADLADTLEGAAYRMTRPAEALVYLIKRLDYERILRRRDKETAADRTENVNLLITVARQAQDMEDFLYNLSLGNVVRDEAGGRVNVMTIHAAKGLEFGVVFITGLEDGLFPHSRSSSNIEIEEERRLAYVALTRAKDELYLTRARVRRQYGRVAPVIPSRFLKELPKNMITKM